MPRTGLYVNRRRKLQRLDAALREMKETSPWLLNLLAIGVGLMVFSLICYAVQVVEALP